MLRLECEKKLSQSSNKTFLFFHRFFLFYEFLLGKGSFKYNSFFSCITAIYFNKMNELMKKMEDIRRFICLIMSHFLFLAQIVNWRTHLKFPEEAKLSAEAKDLISKLMCNVNQRLGSKGAGEIKVLFGVSYSRFLNLFLKLVSR